MNNSLYGILVPTVTPFTKNYEIDETALRDHIDFLIESGVSSIIPCGSTGKISLLSSEERIKVVEFVTDKVKTKVPIVPALRMEDLGPPRGPLLARTREEKQALQECISNLR